jgi:hypothetical protein
MPYVCVKNLLTSLCNTAEILVDSSPMPTSKKSLAERSKTPICIRFRAKDLETIRYAAARSNEPVTLFVREAVLLRIERKEQGLDVPILRYDERVGYGKPFSVRFQLDDFRRVAKAAAEEDRSVPSWARAVAVEFANRRKTSCSERPAHPTQRAAVGE